MFNVSWTSLIVSNLIKKKSGDDNIRASLSLTVPVPWFCCRLANIKIPFYKIILYFKSYSILISLKHVTPRININDNLLLIFHLYILNYLLRVGETRVKRDTRVIWEIAICKE